MKTSEEVANQYCDTLGTECSVNLPLYNVQFYSGYAGFREATISSQ